MYNKEIVDRVKLLIEKSNLSVNAYAQKIGISPQNLYACVRGRVPSVEILQKILIAFPDVSAEWLLMGEGRINKEDAEFLKEQIRVKDEQIEALIKKLK